MDGRIKKLIKNAQWIIIFTIGWIILNEKFDIFTVGIGFIISFFSLIFTEKYFLKGSYYKRYPLDLFKMLKYFIIVFGQIYKEGFISIIKICTCDINPHVIKIKTGMGNDFETGIIANSITLVPGTVSLDTKYDQITCLCLYSEKKRNK